MSEISVFFDNSDKEYEADYEVGKGLEVKIYNIPPKSGVTTSTIDYDEITIIDNKNKKFYYSPSFYITGETLGPISCFKKYNSNFYFETSNPVAINDFNKNMKIKSIRLFNPMLIYYFNNPCLIREQKDNNLKYFIDFNNKEEKEIILNENNISKIVFSGTAKVTDINYNQDISINTENYLELELIEAISCDEILSYVYEFDVFMNAYTFTRQRSYKVIVKTENGYDYLVKHNSFGENKFYKGMIYRPINMNFFEFIPHIYKEINFRNFDNKNKVLPLDLKSPTSLEDEFLYYFRYIDLYMGEQNEKEGKDNKNFYNIKRFVDEYENLFNKVDINSNLVNEIDSLRNIYIHKGYYLKDNQFDVLGKRKKVLCTKTMDYEWLIRIVHALKKGTYIILYKNVLNLDINEDEIKRFCN